MTATGGTAAAEAGGRVAALAKAIGRTAATAVLEPSTVNAPGVELAAGGGEVRRTRDR